MANITVEVTSINLSAIEGRLHNLKPLYKAWANHVEGLTVTAFKAERAPYGQPWQGLSDRYREYKQSYSRRKKGKGVDPKGKPKASGRKTLQWSGSLYDRIYARVEGDSVVAGAGYKVGAYDLGAIHQFGAPRRNIPARPFLPMDAEGEPLPQLVTELRQMAEDYFQR